MYGYKPGTCSVALARAVPAVVTGVPRPGPCSVVKEKLWSAGAVPDLNKAISITAVTSIERRAETGLEGGGRALVDMQLGCRTNRRSWQGRGCNAQHDAERSDRARRSVAVTGVGCVSLSLSLSDERHTQESILHRTVAM